MWTYFHGRNLGHFYYMTSPVVAGVLASAFVALVKLIADLGKAEQRTLAVLS